MVKCTIVLFDFIAAAQAFIFFKSRSLLTVIMAVHRQTDQQNDYDNPSCACTLRVNDGIHDYDDIASKCICS